MKKQSSKGSVLIAVAMLSLVMTVMAIGIVSINSSQSLSNRHQIERIKAEQVAKGAFWNNYMSLVTTGSPSTADEEILDSKKFIPTVTPAGTGPEGTQSYEIEVQYNLPQ